MSSKRYRYVKIVLWIILFFNFAVATVKVGVGIACKSNSVMADGIHSFADGTSNIVGLIGIWFASKPRDARHPYGHDKFEIMASLFIGIMLAIMSVQIMTRAIATAQNPFNISVDYIQVLLMVITIVINSIVAITEYSYGKKLVSPILITDSLHTRGDILISFSVLLALIGMKMGIPVWIDVVMSIVVAIAVLISAWQIIKNCVDILVDSTVLDCNEIKSLLMPIPGIYDVHQVRSRGELSHAFIEFHVVVDPDENIEHSHQLSHKLESVLKEHYGPDTEVNIHFEPDDGNHIRLCDKVTK